MEPLFDLWGRTVAVGGSLPMDAVSDALLRMHSAKKWQTPITLYLGVRSEPQRRISAAEALQICALIRSLRSPVHTVGLGLLHGFEPLVLAAGKPGQRHLLPSALISLGGLEVDDVPLPNGTVGLSHRNHGPSLRDQACILMTNQIRELAVELGLPGKLWARPRVITAAHAVNLGFADQIVPKSTRDRQLLLALDTDYEKIIVPTQS